MMNLCHLSSFLFSFFKLEGGIHGPPANCEQACSLRVNSVKLTHISTDVTPQNNKSCFFSA